VAPFKTWGLNGSAIADGTLYKVGFDVLQVSRRFLKSWLVMVYVVSGFHVGVWGELVIEVAASSLSGGGLCDVTLDGASTKGGSLNASRGSRGGSGVSQTWVEVVTSFTSGELTTLVVQRGTTPSSFGLNEVNTWEFIGDWYLSEGSGVDFLFGEGEGGWRGDSEQLGELRSIGERLRSIRDIWKQWA
jgi:hypothetical protein